MCTNLFVLFLDFLARAAAAANIMMSKHHHNEENTMTTSLSFKLSCYHFVQMCVSPHAVYLLLAHIMGQCCHHLLYVTAM